MTRRTDEDIERDWENIKAITGMNDRPDTPPTDAARIIAALVADEHAGMWFNQHDYWIGQWTCAHCGELDPHAPDCPILAGRAWLAAQQAEAGDG
jgi:hypothetical protein